MQVFCCFKELGSNYSFRLKARPPRRNKAEGAVSLERKLGGTLIVITFLPLPPPIPPFIAPFFCLSPIPRVAQILPSGPG